MLAIVKWHLHKPKRSVTHGEVLNDFRAQGHLNALNSREEQLTQGVVKLIEFNGVLECRAGLEQVSLLVGFHRTQVGSEAKITNLAQNFCG